jgi:hypothetical protein
MIICKFQIRIILALIKYNLTYKYLNILLNMNYLPKWSFFFLNGQFFLLNAKFHIININFLT